MEAGKLKDLPLADDNRPTKSVTFTDVQYRHEGCVNDSSIKTTVIENAAARKKDERPVFTCETSKIFLEVTKGPQKGQRIEIRSGQTFTIGVHSGNDMCVYAVLSVEDCVLEMLLHM